VIYGEKIAIRRETVLIALNRDSTPRFNERYIPMTKNAYVLEIQELLDKALNELSPEVFNTLLDDISMIMSDYE